MPITGVKALQEHEVARTEARARAEEQAQRDARKIAAYAIKRVAAHATYFKARTRGGLHLLNDHFSDQTHSLVTHHLLQEAIAARVFTDSDTGGISAYDGWWSSIEVIGLAGKRVKSTRPWAPSLNAVEIVRLVASAPENIGQTPPQAPVYLTQTGKEVEVLGLRAYRTSSDPGQPIRFSRRMSEAAYTEARGSMPRVSADVMLYDPLMRTVLLGTRQQEPHPGDWVIGGRMIAGEGANEAAERNMKRELNLIIDRKKLVEVGQYSLEWDSRTEGPGVDSSGQEIKGCHDISNLFMYPVNQRSIDLSLNQEYSAAQWVPTHTIVTAPQGRYHPCLVDMVADLHAIVD